MTDTFSMGPASVTTHHAMMVVLYAERHIRVCVMSVRLHNVRNCEQNSTKFARLVHGSLNIMVHACWRPMHGPARKQYYILTIPCQGERLACKDAFRRHLKTRLLTTILIKLLHRTLALFLSTVYVFYRGIQGWNKLRKTARAKKISGSKRP